LPSLWVSPREWEREKKEIEREREKKEIERERESWWGTVFTALNEGEKWSAGFEWREGLEREEQIRGREKWKMGSDVAARLGGNGVMSCWVNS
jgi:hypothetical protein